MRTAVAMAAAGGGVVLLVTALTLPALWRHTDPGGLRTEQAARLPTVAALPAGSDPLKHLVPPEGPKASTDLAHHEG